MKKLTILVSMLVLLAACASNDNDEQTTTDKKQDVSTETSENQTVSNEDNSEGEIADEEADTKKDAEEEQLASFSEYDVLADEVNIKELKAEVKADNSNKRVMILKDESGEKKYKSIYIKKKERLKIISLDDEGQIYNEIIK